ncbi:MAG: helix-turn-helix domain-containing protein [Clostridiales bacterium]|jgi:sugar diacid utilization regulator|nr:helix-turn-helix domain-containing protein [Eubacteriales bacterium]MDH7566975.1 helix-turn-helix domain-containing protein [Clostridiales bacterium]
MGITISVLSDKLKRYNPEIFINQPEAISIYDVELYEENQSYFDPDILYIIKSSSFHLLNVGSYVNILCVMDNALQVEYLKKLNGNILILKKDVDIDLIYEEIRTLLEGHKQLVKNSEKLHKLVFEGKGLQKILDAGYEMLGNPIRLEDADSKLIAYAMKNRPDGSRSNLILKDYYFDTSRSIFRKYASQKKPDKAFTGNSAVYIKDTDEYASIVSNVVIENKQIARLTVTEIERPFKAIDYEVVSLLCKVISLEMQKDKFNKNAKGFLYEYLILDLLEGRIKTPLLIEERVKACNWDLKRNLFLLAITTDFYDNHNMEIKDALQNMFNFNRSIIYNNHIVVIVDSNDKRPMSEQNLASLKAFLKSNSICGGFSRRFNELKDIAVYYRQALKAIELGSYLGRDKVVFFYEDYAVYHMVDVCSNQENLKKLCNPALLELIEYDRKNNTSYTYSLYVFLKHKGNHKGTSEELHIYPSTLIYRLNKIKGIINSELNDEDFNFQLFLSFKMLEYLNELNFTVDCKETGNSNL